MATIPLVVVLQFRDTGFQFSDVFLKLHGALLWTGALETSAGFRAPEHAACDDFSHPASACPVTPEPAEIAVLCDGPAHGAGGLAANPFRGSAHGSVLWTVARLMVPMFVNPQTLNQRSSTGFDLHSPFPPILQGLSVFKLPLLLVGL